MEPSEETPLPDPDVTPSPEIRSKISALTGLVLSLRSIEGRQRRQEAVSKVPLQLIFDCLGYGDDELGELATQVLEEILVEIDVEVLVAEHLSSLLSGLDFPSDRIVVLSLRQLIRFADSPTAIHSLHSAGLFDKSISLLEHSSGAVALAATEFFLRLAKTETGRQLVFDPVTIKRLQDMFESSTTRFRVLSLFTALCEISPEISQQCKSTGILSNLVSDLKSPDALVKLNAIELCSELLAKSGNGKVLDELGIFAALSGALELKARPDVVDVMCASKALLLFCETSKLPNSEPFFRSLARTYDLFTYLKKMMYNDDCGDIQETAVVGVGIIGSTASGLDLLENEGVGNAFPSKPKKPRHSLLSETSLLYSLVDIFTRDPHARQDLKISVLRALTMLFEVRLSDETTEKGLLEKLFESLEMAYEEDKRPSDPSLLLKLVREPKELVRYAAYGFLQNLVIHSWGKRKVVSTPGLLDHLLDRTTESEKLGKEWKFAVVQGLGARINIHHDVLERIQRFLKDGPFFAGSQVAVEGMHL